MSLMLDNWAHDPPGGDFTTIPQPESWPLPKVRASRGVSRRAARAMNELVRSIATEGSLVRAITQAFERAQAAHQASEPSAEARQLSAAVDYATQVIGVIDGRSALVARVRAALRTSALVKTRLTRADLRRIRRQIRRHGLPKQMRRTLRRIGLSAADQARLRNRLLKTDPARINLQSALAVFSDPALLRSERASADAFTQLATSLG
jgi:hypothetical protein